MICFVVLETFSNNRCPRSFFSLLNMLIKLKYRCFASDITNIEVSLYLLNLRNGEGPVFIWIEFNLSSFFIMNNRDWSNYYFLHMIYFKFSYIDLVKCIFNPRRCSMTSYSLFCFCLVSYTSNLFTLPNYLLLSNVHFLKQFHFYLKVRNLKSFKVLLSFFAFFLSKMMCRGWEPAG